MELKIHKTGSRPRPIILQVTTPIYQLTKTNKLHYTFPIIIVLNLLKNLLKFLKCVNLTIE